MQPDRLEQQSLDQGRAISSVLHRASPRAKLIAVALLLILAATFPPTWLSVRAGVPISWVHVAITLVVVAGIVVSGIPLNYLARRLMMFAAPLALVTLSIPLTHGAAGWGIMAGVLSKALLSFTMIVLLVYTTGFDQLLRAMRQCGVPKLLVAMLAATYRYIFVLLEELERMRRAQYARTFDCPRRLSPVTIRNGAQVIGMLLLRCSERAERVHAAMLARGFDGEVRSYEETR